MNKILTLSMTLSMALATALALTACVDDGEELAFGEEVSELTIGNHYCVAQSTASAYRTNNPWGPPACSVFVSSLPSNTALSGGHPVRLERFCGNPTYVNVLSLWTGSYYMMRADALGGC